MKLTEDLSEYTAESLDSALFPPGVNIERCSQEELRHKTLVSELGHITLLCCTFSLSRIDKDEGDNGTNQPFNLLSILQGFHIFSICIVSVGW